MSDTESLYSLSASPPPPDTGQAGSTEHDQPQKMDTQETIEQPDKPNGSSGTSTSRFQQAFQGSFKAPTARMTEPLQKDESSASPTPNPDIRHTGENNAVERSLPPRRPHTKRPKEGLDYDREIAAADAARDRSDPDYSDNNAGIPVARKRQRTTKTPSAQPTNKTIVRYRNVPYAICSDKTKAERDKYIAQIQTNWGTSAVKDWIPAESMPKMNRKGGTAGTATTLDHPRDWKESLLYELLRLSRLTKKKPHQARQALADAIVGNEKGRRGLELFPEAIQRAIRGIEGESTAPETASRESSPNLDASLPRPTDAEPEGEERNPTRKRSSNSIRNRPLETLTAPPPASPTSLMSGIEVGNQQDTHTTSRALSTSISEDDWNQDAEEEKYEELDLQLEEEKARLAIVQASRARFEQKRRMNEWARRHGNKRESGYSSLDGSMLTED